MRPARRSDLGAIDRLLATLARTLGEPGAYAGDVDALCRYGFGPQRLFRTLLAEGAGATVGLCIYFAEFSTWRGEPGLYVQDIVVDETWRGAGVGGRLLRAAARDAGEAWGARYLRLAVDAGNRGGQAFYRATGFTMHPQSRVMQLRGEAFDALVRPPAR